MAITRTVMVDDDGSGTTGTILNNAWLQTIYTQIDAATIPTVAAWTVTDASGAALVFSYRQGEYAKYGRMVFLQLQVVYPATGNALGACLGGLPFPALHNASLSVAYGASTLGAMAGYLDASEQQIKLLNAGNSLQLQNVQISGCNLIASGMYLTS